MDDDVAKRFRAFIRRRIRSGVIEIDGSLDLHAERVFDAIAKLGQRVFELWWNTGPPIYRRGRETVYRLDGRYFRKLPGPRWAGPFPSLLDSLGGAVRVGRATKEISCSEWTDEELIARMELVDPRPRVLINLELWRREDLERMHRRLTGRVPDQGYLAPDISIEIFPEHELVEDESVEHDPVEQGSIERGPVEPTNVTAAEGQQADVPPVFIGTSYQGPEGRAILVTSGPPDPLGIRTDELRRADGLLRTGMVALGKCHPPQLERAERCFHEALDLLGGVWEEPHPRISYALDRIGVVRHFQGDLHEAEGLYLRSLKVLGEGARPTPWNDVTLLNLASLYQSQGRAMESEAVMAYHRGDDAEGAS